MIRSCFAFDQGPLDFKPSSSILSHFNYFQAVMQYVWILPKSWLLTEKPGSAIFSQIQPVSAKNFSLPYSATLKSAKVSHLQPRVAEFWLILGENDWIWLKMGWKWGWIWLWICLWIWAEFRLNLAEEWLNFGFDWLNLAENGCILAFQPDYLRRIDWRTWLKWC